MSHSPDAGRDQGRCSDQTVLQRRYASVGACCHCDVRRGVNVAPRHSAFAQTGLAAFRALRPWRVARRAFSGTRRLVRLQTCRRLSRAAAKSLRDSTAPICKPIDPNRVEVNPTMQPRAAGTGAFRNSPWRAALTDRATGVGLALRDGFRRQQTSTTSGFRPCCVPVAARSDGRSGDIGTVRQHHRD